jgi:hypothetical protein
LALEKSPTWLNARDNKASLRPLSRNAFMLSRSGAPTKARK